MSIITAEESRKAYVERKNQVLNILEEAKKYYTDDERQDIAEVFEGLYHDLLNGEFSIVVVGEFSAGKSTLLNALMGKRILPSFSNETTATVNFLRHSDKASNGEAGRVFYNNGEQEIIKDATLATIEKYVSTKGNEVANRVEHLDLYLDSDFLKDGVTLVDSPGLNGVADGHREITEAQILKSHASIFLFNSDHPGSKTDFEFLHELQSRVKTIIFVLNKIDAINCDEEETPETVIETLKKTYQARFPEESTVPEIWPVAAYPALVARNKEPLVYHDKINRTVEEKERLEEVSRLVKFEDRLMSFLTCGEKTKYQLLSPVERVLALTKETENEYEQEIALLKNTIDTSEIDNQIAIIKENIEGIQGQINISKQEIATQISDALHEVREEVSAQMSRLQKSRINEIDEFNDVEELMDYLREFENSFKQKVKNIALNQEDNLRDKILTIVKMQYTNHAGIIEQDLLNSNSDIDLSVSTHLDTGERVFEVGLEKMNEKTKLLEEQLKVLEDEVKEAEQDCSKQRALERKREKLENEIKNLKNEKQIVEEQILPPIDRYTKQVYRKEKRGGIFGAIGDVLFGEKTVTRYEERIDSRDYEVAKERQQKKVLALETEIEKKSEELNKIGDVDSDSAELRRMGKYVEVENMRKILERVMVENNEKIDDQYKREIKKFKRKLSNYCDEITSDLNSQVKKYLRKSEQNYVELVMNVVEGALKQEFGDKQKRLEQLEKQLQFSQENRNERIELLEDKIMRINELMYKAVELREEINSIPVDIIQQQTI